MPISRIPKWVPDTKTPGENNFKENSLFQESQSIQAIDKGQLCIVEANCPDLIEVTLCQR